MIIQVNRLAPDGAEVEGEEPAAILEVGPGALFRVLGPVACRLHAQLVSGQLVVRGSLAVEMEFGCSKCGAFFSTTVADSSFLRAYEVPEGTESVDLTDDIREGILLHVPNYPVCSRTCRGLCPQCGRNWNEGPCACRPVVVNDAWSKLNELQMRTDGPGAGSPPENDNGCSEAKNV